MQREKITQTDSIETLKKCNKWLVDQFSAQWKISQIGQKPLMFSEKAIEKMKRWKIIDNY